MTITDRAFGPGDYELTRELVMACERLGGPTTWWGLDRLDSLCAPGFWEAAVSRPRPSADTFHVWEDDGRLVGVVHPESGEDEAFLELRPDCTDLADRMLEWAEGRHLAAARAAGAGPIRPLATTSNAADSVRAAILARRGWEDLGPAEVVRTRSLAVPCSPARLPDGYSVRLADPEDSAELDAVAALTNIVFGVQFSRATIMIEHRFASPRETVAVFGPDGSVASWCGITVEPAIGVGWFEPVGTHPDHRRLGLAAAAMTHGMERMRERGARLARVGTGVAMAANRLYVTLGFDDVQVYHSWRRVFD
jgi:GNAT superfamily N-acetyltransferase